MNPGISFVLVDFGGTNIRHVDVVACASAFSKQLSQHHALPPPFGWGISATCRAAVGPTDIHSNEWIIGLFARADQANALGYHGASARGRPFAKVFPLLDAADGVSWTTTVSHEGIEIADDPELNVILQAPNGRLWAEENGDPNEQGIVIVDGVPLSDFVLPPWYGGGTGRCNWLGTLAPGEVGPGGYAQYLDPARGWVQIEHAQVLPRAYRRSQHNGRSERRRARLTQP
jgi:hypothetical protein